MNFKATPKRAHPPSITYNDINLFGDAAVPATVPDPLSPQRRVVPSALGEKGQSPLLANIPPAKTVAKTNWHIFIKPDPTSHDRFKADFPFDLKEKFDEVFKSTAGAWKQYNPYAKFKREDENGKFWWINKVTAEALNPIFFDLYPESSFFAAKPPAITLEGCSFTELLSELRRRCDKVKADATEEGIFPDAMLLEPATQIADIASQIAGQAKGLQGLCKMISTKPGAQHLKL
jgi:hypothetical protein